MPFEKSVGTRDINSIEFAVIHHDAAFRDMDTSVRSILWAHARYHIGKGWGHIAYHYAIDRDGKVYRLTNEREIGYHAGNWQKNLKGLGVVLLGDLTQQKSTPEQVGALWRVMDWLTTQRPDLPKLLAPGMKGHKEVRWKPTSCPSPQVQRIVEAYRML